MPVSKEYLAREIDNIVKACNDVWDDADGHFQALTPDIIKEFNRRVLSELELPEHVVPGRMREYSVGVAGYRAAPAEDCDYLLKRLCDWLGSDELRPPNAQTALACPSHPLTS